MAIVDINQMLQDRGSQYGEFRLQGFIAQRLKDVVRETPGYDRMEDDQREALEMVLHKISRLCSGNPNHLDSWVDIQGYAKLVSDRLKPGD